VSVLILSIRETYGSPSTSTVAHEAARSRDLQVSARQFPYASCNSEQPFGTRYACAGQHHPPPQKRDLQHARSAEGVALFYLNGGTVGNDSMCAKVTGEWAGRASRRCIFVQSVGRIEEASVRDRLR